MLVDVIDRPWVRVALGAFIGVPITAAALIGAIYGAVFLVGGVRDSEFWAIGLGLVATLGVLGIAGAWRRILKRHAAMPHRERVVVRGLLLSGIAASIVLGGWAVQADWVAAGLSFALLTIGGVALVLATPVAL